MHYRKYYLALVLLGAAVAALASAASGEETKKIPATRVDTPPSIDGSLDDPCWRSAAKGGGMMIRSVGTPATEPTDFYVCYDSAKLYFGIYCHDSHPEGIVAKQQERDSSLSNDDFVRIYLDTYHEHRTADEFSVNVIGTQRDERKRGTTNRVGWKGDWYAAAKRVDDGWTAEMEIPFSILNYRAGATSMGLNIYRKEQRLGEKADWTYLDNDEQLIRYGDLEGLILPPPQRQPLQIMPFLLRYFSSGGNTGRVGLDMKKQFGDDNTALFTAFPDFGTVENAVKSIDFSYTAPRYPDNRPFFQEASSVFGSPYVYTNDIPDFDYGMKVFGRQGKAGYGLMRCLSVGNRTDTMLTASYDLPALTNAKLMMINRRDDAMNNDVLSLSLNGQPIPSTSWWMRGAQSLTAGAANNGADFAGGFAVDKSRLYFDGSFRRVSNFFYPATGYVDYPGAMAYDFGGEYSVDQPGRSLRNYRFDCGLGRTWDAGHGLIGRSADFGGSVTFANHTSWRLSHSWGPHIANYDADTGTPYYWNDDSSYTLNYNFNTTDQYRSGGVSYRWGQVGGGPSQSIRFNSGFRPFQRLSTSISVQRVYRSNPEEGTITQWLGIFGGKYALTPERSISLRLLRQVQGTNMTLSYRQQVRKGLDIFALFGDYNADSTVSKFSIKFVTTQ